MTRARDHRGRFMPKGAAGAAPRLPTVPSGRIPLNPGTTLHTPVGPRFGDRLLRRLQSIDALHGVTVAVGLQGQVAPAAAPTNPRPGTVPATANELVLIGRAHEFGLGVPERPWLRTALAQHGKVWTGGLKVAVKQRAQGSPERATITLRLLGTAMVSDTQGTLAAGPWEPLSARTIAIKGSSVPLIDTAQMAQSIRATVDAPGVPPELVG